ncbi:MAG: bifunctional (p)ppGpp synthetase/guanosine-3',5'-bis(diphosphate) 3'-pyrophosphohydrolase [Clostridiales bacterium]|nr:bifunctional (p)ppGpp synthetase/guanosine-3',5'-bis(diphosphate) 3'-pyrophosphohydrolase [Clostridiales bacterium]
MLTELYDKLIKRIRTYNEHGDLSLIEKAYLVAKDAHAGQERLSGEPFLVHPLKVAYILAEIELDTVAIVAAILHDVVEDTSYTKEQLQEEFGEEVYMLVDGVTKLGKISYTTKEEQQVENLRKMFLAMAKNIRVVLIKLADRLHNMRTLKYMPKDKQYEKAKETLEIYAPLAHRLGISKIKWELEDLSLRYLDPDGYYELVNKIATKRQEREVYVEDIVNTLKEKTKELGIKCSVDGRPKHFYSIYRKMKTQQKTLEQIYDLFALRVIVSTVKECYMVLGLVHDLYKPVPGRFKDYIAMPKANMYQSLHTTLIGPKGFPIEIQIRTWDMHKVAEVGIAAHWKYKEGKTNNDLDAKLEWLRMILDWQKDTKDARQFMKSLRVELFEEEVFVFTPKGDVVSLPYGSTPIDFAYRIHSDVGDKMMGAKVNNKIVTLTYKLKNGDIVEILTSASVQGPSRDWLKIVKSSHARNKINQWFKKNKKEENVLRGKELLERESKKSGISFAHIASQENIEEICNKYKLNGIEELYLNLGVGNISPKKIITLVKVKEGLERENDELGTNVNDKQHKKKDSSLNHQKGVIVKGVNNCLVKFSQCCNPVPGDEIVGFITKGRGVSVHRSDCDNVVLDLQNRGRLIEVSWIEKNKDYYKTDIKIKASDRVGLIVEVTNITNDLKIPLISLNAQRKKNRTAEMIITLKISNTKELDKIIKRYSAIEGVYYVERKKG